MIVILGDKKYCYFYFQNLKDDFDFDDKHISEKLKKLITTQSNNEYRVSHYISEYILHVLHFLDSLQFQKVFNFMPAP